MSDKETLVEKVWGGRRLATLFGKRLPKGKRIGEWWLYCGKVVIKLLDVRKPLSIQVHPKGKSELWYVIEAGPSTRVLGGITLDEYKVRKGDWIFLPAGTVHTILPPAVILEISERSFITYRLYDWGRGTRPLDIEKGIRALDINAKPRIYRNIFLSTQPLRAGAGSTGLPEVLRQDAPLLYRYASVFLSPKV